MRFAANNGMTIADALEAVGSAAEPIVFTGTVATPGSWQGLSFYGSNAAPLKGTAIICCRRTLCCELLSDQRRTS